MKQLMETDAETHRQTLGGVVGILWKRIGRMVGAIVVKSTRKPAESTNLVPYWLIEAAPPLSRELERH